ncbi:MAG: phosphoenolpyruvate--protein phosphotransferase, partial [Candidatus Krumholzibacteria bacterium]|nr:phosphoenolpyruvate--protein phosphotransferase [Candidatus Krumholzibacteria bacterium]
HARIFDAHLLILDDVLVVDDTEALIRNENCNAAWAFEKVISNVTSTFADIEDEYLKDRYADIVDVKKRVLHKLLGGQEGKFRNPSVPSVVVAYDLSPSETAQLDRRVVLGYATSLGGRTSHTAILARSQGVAAVVGLEGLSLCIETGDKVIVDGNCGALIVNPLAETREIYQREIKRYREFEEQLLTLTGYPAETLDNRKIELMANIDLPTEVGSALEHGAEGIGLFRTEYFFMTRDQLPSEQEQYQVYRSVIQEMDGKPVTIRVLDIGGDKIAGYLHDSRERNPFMGWRGIRFLLARRDILKTQLRAIYRASAHGKVKILLPLIVDLDEVLKTKEICQEIREELKSSRFRVDQDVPLGVMIETPAAVVLADALAKEVDFFSIGTNDLIQYTMAVDRGNSRIAHLYQNLHPSIIRFLKMTVDAGRKNKIPVAICGEMAVDPLSAILLIGLQIDEFSCSPNMMPEIKKIIRSVTYDECKMFVKKVLRYRTAEQTQKEVRALLKERCPDLAMFGEPA